MRLTNRAKLPDAILQAIKNDPYSKGASDFSVTELLAPPRQRALMAKHKDELVEDIEDRLWSLYGQVAHGILERANRTAIVEKRYFAKIAGAVVSGQVDTLDLEDGILSDYKFTTAYKFKEGGEEPPEWVAQLNMQNQLLRMNGIRSVTKLRIVGLLRDFSKLDAMRDRKYPQRSIMGMWIPLWDEEKALKFIEERITLHRNAREVLPMCSDEERWAKKSQWAVMKRGQKKALKLYDTEQAALSHAGFDEKLTVEARPGENTRCKAYCSVANFCSQYQALRNPTQNTKSTKKE